MNLLTRTAVIMLLAAAAVLAGLQPAAARTRPARPPGAGRVHSGQLHRKPVRGQELPYVTIGYHTIRAGDTLWSLARRYLGDPHAWSTLAKANDVNPRRLQIGFVLTLVLPAG